MKTMTTAAALSALLLLVPSCSANVTTNTNAGTASNAANRPANTAANTANTNAAAATTPASANTSSNTAPAQGAQDFTLVNSTGVEIHAVYISPHDTEDWEEDILGRDTLPAGESVEIKFDRDETAAMWDLRVEDKDGNAIEWENLNLLQISKLTLYYKDGKATAEAQ